MILHTLSASPASPAFADCLLALAAGDALLLLGDGVYAAIRNSAARVKLEESGAALFLLECDAAAAGILGQAAGVTAIDTDGFVALTERYPRQMAWY